MKHNFQLTEIIQFSLVMLIEFESILESGLYVKTKIRRRRGLYFVVTNVPSDCKTAVHQQNKVGFPVMPVYLSVDEGKNILNFLCI